MEHENQDRDTPNQTVLPEVNIDLSAIPENILNHTIDVTGSYDAAMEWLTTPSIALGSIPPITLMGTEVGTQEVENELVRIEAGVL